MILYFSATGNCKYVATRLAKAFDEESVSITECIGKNRYVFEDKTIGVVSPTYFWGLPSIVKEFLEKASFKTEYLYFVATYGTTPGAVGNMAKRQYKTAVSTPVFPFEWLIHGRRCLTYPLPKRSQNSPKQRSGI